MSVAARSPASEAGASPSAAGTAGGICVVSTFAGKAGEPEGAVDGGASEARFSGEPQSSVMDSRGDMFVIDT
jgi:hypothetical protein